MIDKQFKKIELQIDYLKKENKKLKKEIKKIKKDIEIYMIYYTFLGIAIFSLFLYVYF